MNNALWVYVQLNGQKVEPTSLQLITKARQIAEGRPVVALLAEDLTTNAEETVKEYGPDEIIVLKDGHFTQPTDGELADALFQVVSANTPNGLLFPATVQGRSVAPRLQAKLRTGLTADCLDVYYDGEDLIQVKPTYGDYIMCEILCPDHRPQMATVRPNTFNAEKVTGTTVQVTVADFTFHPEANIEVVSEKPIISSSANIADAKIVVALGRGADNDKTIALAEKAAAKLGGMVGVSRPLTDNPKFSHESQIGQSGNTIAPDLLINLGVSGAVQYTVGIENAGKVVSVNTDDKAPIFAVSDFGYVGTANEFLEALVNDIK